MRKDKSYIPPRVCQEEDIFCRRVQHRNLIANKKNELKKIEEKCKASKNTRRCFTELEGDLFRLKPEYASDWPEIPIYNPKKFKFMGFTKRCKEWYVGVVINRHFVHKKEWKINDYSFDSKGKVKYCKGYIQAPVMKRISNAGRYGKAYLAKLRASDVKELCKQNLSLVVNKYSKINGKEFDDKLRRECELQFGDGSVGKIDTVINNPNTREVHAFEFDKMRVEKIKDKNVK